MLLDSHLLLGMPNAKKTTQNFINKVGIICSTLFGDLNGETFKKTAEEIAELINILRSKNRPALILTDVTNLGGIRLTARKIGVEVIKKLDYDRWAFYGCSYSTVSFIKLMIVVSGRGFKIQIFDNKKEAERWLLSK